ncbi:MAG: divalent-cation tolerance protein CutA [Kofleriaceae bacterium]
MADLVDPALRIVISTFPTADKAAEIARVLVDEQLAACVNVVPQIRSIYRWQGAVQDDVEALALIKTTDASVAALTQRLLELHPYDVPEVIALPISAATPAYGAWLRDSVKT